MKKLLSTIEILSVFFIFVLPPLLASPDYSSRSVQISLNLYTLGMFLSCFFLFLIHRDVYKKRFCNSPKPGIFLVHSLCLTGFGTLVLISAVFQALTAFIAHRGGNAAVTTLVLPSSPFLWLSLVLSVFLSAFSEEFLYRFYIPDFISDFFEGKFRFLFEILAVLIFAFSHRYQGWQGVLNALACGSILRVIFVKTQSLWISFGIHVFYNFITILFSAVL